MKIKKDITVDTEVEFHIGVEDIALILEESNDVNFVLKELNDIAQFVKGVPDSIIEQFSPEQRKAVCNFFKEKSKRFEA